MTDGHDVYGTPGKQGSESQADGSALAEAAEGLLEAALGITIDEALDVVYEAAMYRCGRDERRAEDLTQLVFEKLIRSAKSERGLLVTRAHALLRKTTANLSIDEHRREKSRPTEVSDASQVMEFATENGSSAVEEEVVQRHHQAIVREMLASLTPESRRIVTQVMVEGIPLREVAEQLGIPKSTLEYRVDVLKKELRNAARELGYTGEL